MRGVKPHPTASLVIPEADHGLGAMRGVQGSITTSNEKRALAINSRFSMGSVCARQWTPRGTLFRKTCRDGMTHFRGPI